MELNVNELKLNRDKAASSLVEILRGNGAELNVSDSYVYHNFPLYRDVDDSSSRANILLISRNYGVLIFECSNLGERDSDLTDKILMVEENLEQTFSQIYSKLIKSKALRAKRNALKVEVIPILFLPLLNKGSYEESDEFEYLKDLSDLKEFLSENVLSEVMDLSVFKETVAIIEGSKGIIKPPERVLSDVEKQFKGAILQDLELEVANFDMDQKRAALNMIDGPQRIRGLAGSGKTIILTWKAALMHLENPDAVIIYTFYTKSLYQVIKQLITRFYRQYSDIDPNWDKIQILHAWGGRNMPGVYYNICNENGERAIPFSEARKLGRNPFNEICKVLESKNLKIMCDYLLIDEAQDSPIYFYRLCRKITRNSAVVWGYDECQNILDVEIQDTVETFGRDQDGQPYVDLSAIDGLRNDVVLHKCYRNPRNILVLGFALGMGIYNEPILQMLENNDHWEDLGFKVNSGDSSAGSKMVVERLLENSPMTLDQKNNENIKVKIFENSRNVNQECQFIIESILEDIKRGLLPEDILVISLDDINTPMYFNLIEKNLIDSGVKVFNIQKAPYNTKVFKQKDHVTLSTVYKAKGNESASVYIFGIDSTFSSRNSITNRNKIFTAITRSKCWLTITGLGPHGKNFKEEVDKALAKAPYLEFNMPVLDSLKQFQRDMSDSKADINRVERDIEGIAKKRGISVDQLLMEFEFKDTKKK